MDNITFILYLIAGLVCILVALRSHLIFSDRYSSHRLLWFGLAAGMILFGINELLDLQTPFTWFIKDLAWQQGWYESGQQAQNIFLVGLVLISMLLLGLILWAVRKEWRKYWLLIFGLLLIARFVVVRAAYFYGVPLPELSQLIGGLKINWTLEFLGAVMVIIAASANLIRSWFMTTHKQLLNE